MDMQEALCEVSECDMVLIMRDFNAMVDVMIILGKEL